MFTQFQTSQLSFLSSKLSLILNSANFFYIMGLPKQHVFRELFLSIYSQVLAMKQCFRFCVTILTHVILPILFYLLLFCICYFLYLKCLLSIFSFFNIRSKESISSNLFLKTLLQLFLPCASISFPFTFFNK